jgi:hypothetical protein
MRDRGVLWCAPIVFLFLTLTRFRQASYSFSMFTPPAFSSVLLSLALLGVAELASLVEKPLSPSIWFALTRAL